MRYLKVEDIRQEFIRKYKQNEIVRNETGSISGSDTIEIVGASFIADEPTIFGTLDKDYASREIEWYESQSLNVNDIPYGPPKIWKAVASKDGLINSNYGYLIFSESNYLQFENCLAQLVSSPGTRRATMVYTRPSIHYDYNKDGMMDFICTNTVQYLIRDNKLDVVCSLRSNDSIFGYKNDRHWQKYVQENLCNRYNAIASTPIQLGTLYWQAASLHVYERQFHLIEKYIEKYSE